MQKCYSRLQIQNIELAKTVLKIPHAFIVGLASYFGLVYRAILKKVFEGLYDDIVFMEQADVQIAMIILTCMLLLIVQRQL